MGIKSKLFGLTVIGVAVYVGLWCKNCKQPEIPKSYWEDHYWGPKVVKDGKLPVDDKAIRKFAINVPEEVLDDLKGRLNSTRIIESIQGSNFEYGFHSDQLKKVIEYWSTKYDWRKQEAILNKLTHFKTQVEGIDVHYIHAKPTGGATKVYPLLMVHGWPGSVVEFLKIIPMLTTPVDGVAFEIIAPSIPGYGWSEAPSKGGFNHLHAARVFTKLMGRLGFDKFYYQGGDWGAVIGAGPGTAIPGKDSGLPHPSCCPQARAEGCAPDHGRQLLSRPRLRR
ncbi:Juvenile hormone epoxide hydrolase 1 [Halotydeus destructor]|nr:Juvenile hormone epoxide hydrolase 1 [Halotydeus destructor]